MDHIFQLDANTYTNDLDPVKQYIEQASTYLINRYKLNKQDAVKQVKLNLKDKKIKNPNVRYRSKLENGDREETTIKLTDYIKDVKKNNEIIVPSYTAYDNPSKQVSIHKEFLNYNTKQRSLYKKEAFKQKQIGDMDKYLFADVTQKTMKIKNNSVSGGYGSEHTVMYNPSAHYTLTSITRCVSSIGNMVSESMIAGNRLLRDVNTVYNYIATIATYSKKADVEYCINKYKLYIPTPKDVLDILRYSYIHYWEDNKVEEDLLEYLKTLDKTVLVSIAYTNDLWHLRKYNDKLLRTMLSTISKQCTNITQDPNIIYTAEEGFRDLTHIIWGDEIRGMNVNYKELENTPLLDKLCSTCYNIRKEFNYYKMLFNTFFLTDILPTNIAYVKEMLRDTIVLSDTDSTCGSYDKWVEWYYNKLVFNSEAVSITAVVMTIVSRVVDHYLKKLAANMNIKGEEVELLKMKNEFFWSVFIPTNVSKHYTANVCIQEGNVFKEPDLEIKGVQLLMSTCNKDFIKKTHDMIKEINTRLSNGEKLSGKEYATRVADMEREIIARVRKGDVDIFKLDKVKPKDSYTNENSPYLYHVLWNEVFANKYGPSGEPMYMVAKIPMLTDNKKKMLEFIESIEDEYIKESLIAYCKKYKKENIATYKIPTTILVAKGLPEELVDYVNIERIILDNLHASYLILETIGIYRQKDKLLHEMGY